MTRIGLMGPFGYGNLGDAAIQEAMIDNLRTRIPGVEIIAFSLNPPDTQLRHGIPAFPIEAAAPLAPKPRIIAGDSPRSVGEQRKQPPVSRLRHKLGSRIPMAYAVKRHLLFWWTSWVAVGGLDALIVSGGGQLDDVWGGPWNQPFTLLRWALLARMRGVKFLFVSVGAGPIRTGLGRIFIRFALKLACYCSFRDRESLDLLRELGFDSAAEVFPDLAFSLRARPSPPAHASGVKARVGISPMSYGHRDKWPDKMEDVYKRYIDTLAAFASSLAGEGYQVILFPTQIRMDIPAIQDLKSALSEETAARVEDRSMERPITTVTDLLDTLEQMDFIVASRFHGVLLSIFLGKPVLALSYHGKIDTLMREARLSEFCLDIERFGLETLSERFRSLERVGPGLGRELEGLVARYHAALDRQYHEMLSQVVV